MGYPILGFLFLAIVHFVYESIVAPSLRADLSVELQTLRDELRAVEQARPEHANRQCFRDLQQWIEGLLTALDRYGVVLLLLIERESRACLHDREQVEARVASLDQCDIAEVRDIRARSVRVAMRAIAINNGGLLLYTWPAALVLFAYASVRRRFSRLAVQAIDFHQQFGSAYIRVKHDVLSL